METSVSPHCLGRNCITPLRGVCVCKCQYCEYAPLLTSHPFEKKEISKEEKKMPNPTTVEFDQLFHNIINCGQQGIQVTIINEPGLETFDIVCTDVTVKRELPPITLNGKALTYQDVLWIMLSQAVQLIVWRNNI